MRNTFRYASRADWEKLAKDLRPIYTAGNAEQAWLRLEEFGEKLGSKYPAIMSLWRRAWTKFIPFLDYDVEIRRVICSTNAIVIWSHPEGVRHVIDEGVNVRKLPAGHGYLPPSSRRLAGGSGVRSEGGAARLAA